MAAAHVFYQPLPERQRLGVRVVDAVDLHALGHPAEDDITQRQPQAGYGVGGVEVDIDDVLVLFRRVFRITDGAVRPPAEPARVFLEPRVVLGALDGKIQGDFQAMVGSGGHQAAKILAAAQLRMDRLMAALVAADGIRATGVIGAGLQRIVRPLAKVAADGMDGREIQHIETHVADHRQAIVHVVEGAVAFGVVGDRTWEQFVPAGELGALALDLEGKFMAAAQIGPMIGLAHQ
ncbi:hypothetical protein D9M71_399550 [compost metagenome]